MEELKGFDVEPEHWTEGHVKESSFFERKHESRRAQAIREGTVRDASVDVDAENAQLANRSGQKSENRHGTSLRLKVALLCCQASMVAKSGAKTQIELTGKAMLQ